MHDLSQGEFTVELNPNQEYRARFELVINYEIHIASGALSGKENLQDSTATAINNLDAEEFQFVQNSESLVVINPNGRSGTINLYDLTGRLISQQKMEENGNTKVFSWSALSAGSYVVNIINNDEKLYSKQVIKL